MKYLFEQKLIGIIALLFLVGCGGGGGSTPLQLTVASFAEFKLTENSTSGAWVIAASSNKSFTINYSISDLTICFLRALVSLSMLSMISIILLSVM